MAFSIGGIRVQPTQPASVSFEITGPAGTADAVEVEFAAGTGPWRPATRSGPPPASWPASPSGTTNTFTWDAAADLGSGSGTISLRVRASEAGVPGAWATLTGLPRSAVVNTPPRIVFADRFQAALGTVIRFTVADAESEPSLVDIEFREEPAPSLPPAWTPIQPLSGALPAPATTSPSGTLNTFTWDTRAQFAGRAFPRVFVRLTPRDAFQAGATYQMLGPFVPNERVQVWDVEVTGGPPFVVSYRLRDVESDTASIQALYSIDRGATWRPATPAAGAAVTGLATSPTGVTHRFEWDVRADLGSRVHPLVIVRIVPFDVAPGVAGTARPFVLNFPPTCTTVSITPGDPAIVGFDLEDPEGDVCSVEVAYSLDGATWTRATETSPGGATRHLLSRPPNARHVVGWDVRRDLGAVDATNVRVRVTPRDLEEGTAATSAPFDVRLAPGAAPSVAIAPVQSAVHTARTIVGIDLADADASPVWVALEYSLDGGTNWHPATVAAPSLAAPLQTSAAGVRHDLAWDAWADLDERQVTGVRLQVLVQDAGHVVTAASAPFDIDTRPPSPPEIRNAGVDVAGRFGPAVIAFDLVEAESRDCAITAECSLDGGVTWTAATSYAPARLPPPGARRASPLGTRHYFAWDVVLDLGATAAGARLRLTPATTRPGVAVTFDVARASLPAAAMPPPAITTAVLTQAGPGEPVLADITVVDSGCRGVSMTIEYLDAAGVARPATDLASPTGTSLAGLAADPAGTRAVFAWNAALDLNGLSGPYRLRLRPRAPGSPPGAAVETAPLVVDASPLAAHPPAVAALDVRPADRAGVVEVGFTLSDQASVRCDISLEYRNPATGLWSGASMIETSPQFAGSPAGRAVAVHWNALADLGPASFTGVLLRITVRTGTVSAQLTSASFDVRVLTAHPRALAAAAVTVISAGRREPVLLAADVLDPLSEYARTELRFSAAGVSDWRPASLAPEWVMRTSADRSTRGLRWNVVDDLPAGRYRRLRIEATAVDRAGRRSRPVRTQPAALEVWPSEAAPPAITRVELLPGAPGGPAVIEVDLVDVEDSACDLRTEYSTTGGVHWAPATLVDARTARGVAARAAGTTIHVPWNVGADLAAGRWADVRVRVTPANPWVGDPAVSAPVAMDVAPRPAESPVVAGLSAVAANGDELALSASLVHSASAPAAIDVQWSADAGATWQDATPGPGVERYPADGFATAPSPGAAFTWWWDRAVDLGASVSIADALVRVTATADGRAASAEISTGPFTTAAPIASNPALPIDPIVDRDGDHAEIVVVIADPSSVPAAMAVSYSVDGGGSWTTAHGISAWETTGLATSPDGHEHAIRWRLRRDLAAQIWPDVRVRVQAGAASRTSAPFSADLSGPSAAAPRVTVTGVEPLGPGAVAIDFTLMDDRALACELTAEFTCVERPGWTAATGAARMGHEPFAWTSSAAGDIHRWIWAANRDLGDGIWHDVHLRLSLSDGTTPAQIDAAIGDLTYAPPSTAVAIVHAQVERNRSDSVARRVDCALTAATPGPVDLRYSLVTPAGAIRPATMIGVPRSVYATADGLAVSAYWDAEADVPAAMDGQPQTMRVEAIRGGVAIAQADASATTTVGNRGRAPALTASVVPDVTGVVPSPARIRLGVNDPRAGTQDIAIEYSRDGGASWREATAWPGVGDGRDAFPTTGAETIGFFSWDVERDVPERYAKNLQVQARLRSQPSAAPAVARPFDIDLEAPDGHAPTVSITADDGSGPVVPLWLMLYDPDGDLLHTTVEYFSAPEGRWFPATPAGGSDLLDAVPAEAMGTPYRFLWDAQADAPRIFPPPTRPQGAVDVRVTVRKSRAASLSVVRTRSVDIDASPYDAGLRDYPDIRPRTLTVIGGVPQTAVGGQELAAPLTLKLVDAAGVPVPDAELQVLVAPTSALTAELPPSIFTDGSGEARVTVRPEPGRDGELLLDARVVGAPGCRLAAPVGVTVKAARVLLPFPPTAPLTAGRPLSMRFEFGSDDPAAGMTIAYGRPIVLEIDTTPDPSLGSTVEGRADRRVVRLGPGTFAPGLRPSFIVDVVPQAAGAMRVTVAQPGSLPLYSGLFPVLPVAAVQRRVGESAYADARPALVPMSGDDPAEHADGARWPRAGKEQWAWPGLTLQTPLRVKLLIDGRGDGPSPATPTITGPGVILHGPPSDSAFTSPCQGQGVTCAVLATDMLGGATAVDTLKVRWLAAGGVLSRATTPLPTDTAFLEADICEGVYFTPRGYDGPWYVEANVSGAVLDPGRRVWTRSYDDSNGDRHLEIHREDALSVFVSWRFEIQQAPVYLVGPDPGTTEASRIAAGDEALVLARVSPSAGVSAKPIAVNAVQRDGSFVDDYTGPQAPPPFNRPAVPLALQAGARELRSETFRFVRGRPESVTPAMTSFLRAAWVQIATLDRPLAIPTDPPLRARLSLDGRPSVQDAIAGTTPFAGWEGTVALSDCELVYPAAILDAITAYGPLALGRTWRGHLGWERRAWMRDDDARVREWAGAFGPGWIASFEPELVPVPGGFHLMDPNGRITRMRGIEPSNGLRARVSRNPFIDDDHAPIHLELEGHRQWRFHADGTLRDVVDARGHKTRLFYDERSRLRRIVDPHGRAIVCTPGAGALARRIELITDANQRSVAFTYQSAASGGIEGMLDGSIGPAASDKWGAGPTRSFSETYKYDGAPAGTAARLPYAQVRLQEVLRAGESRVRIEHGSSGGVRTQTWNNGTATFTPSPGGGRQFLITFRDGVEQIVEFEGAGADAAAPVRVREFDRASSILRISTFQYNREGRCVRAERPGHIVERWTYGDGGASPDVFDRGNLLAHEVVHAPQPPPAPPAPARYRRLASWEYTDRRNPTAVTAAIPPEASERRVQRSWRTDWNYNQFGEVVRALGPSARASRIAEDGSLHGPSPLPYTLEHRHSRPAVMLEYNADGLVTRMQEPDGLVTEYAYYSQSAFNAGPFSAAGGGLRAQERRDTTDTGERQFWYLGQPVAVRETRWTYDGFGHPLEVTDSRGYRHRTDSNALGLPLRLQWGIPPAGMAGQPLVERVEYDAHWRPCRRIVEQPGGEPEQGGGELVEVTEFDVEDRPTSVSRTISASETYINRIRLGTEGLVEGICRPASLGTQPREVLTVGARDERGLPTAASLKLGRSDRPLEVTQTWDEHGAPRTSTLQRTTVLTYRPGPFGTVAATTDPRLGLTSESIASADGVPSRSRLTADQAGSRSPRRPAGTHEFTEERANERGLIERVHSGRRARPGAGGAGAQPPDPAFEGAPGIDAAWATDAAVERADQGFGCETGRVTSQIRYDILGREALVEDDRTNTLQTTWSPDGTALRERIGERNQLAWNDPLVPWRTERWRWLPGVWWTTEVRRRLDGAGDVAEETIVLKNGAVPSVERTISKRFTYDGFGRVASETNALGHTTRYTYDVHGEVATVTDANGELDATGTTNVDGNRTTYVRDGFGRVIRVKTDMVRGGIAGPSAVSERSIERRYEYTPEGQILSVTDASGFTTTWRYGPNGQLESLISPKPSTSNPRDTTTQRVSYEDDGRPSGRTLASGATRTLRFNGSHQVDRVEIATAGTAAGRLTYEYDGLGRPRASTLVWKQREWTPAGTHEISERRTVERTLDNDGRVVAEIQHGTRRNHTTNGVQRVEHTIRYAHDGEGGVTALVYSDGSRFRLDRDRTGRPLGVIRGKEESILRYEMLGHDFVRERRSGAVIESRDVDAAGQLSSIGVRAGGRPAVEHTIAARDRCGRVKTWHRRALQGATVSETRQFTYDSAGRIVGETAALPTAGTRTVTRRYDGDGTIVFEERTIAPPSGAPTTTTKRSIRGGGGAVFETIVVVNGTADIRRILYDLDGNVAADKQRAFEHDALGRLAAVRPLKASAGSTRYTYDGQGRLVACTRLDAGGRETFREDYVWDDWRLIEVWRAGEMRERYVYGIGLNEIVRADINGVAWVPVYGPDGSVDCLVDVAGRVFESYAYDLDGAVTVFDASRQPVARPPQFRFGFHGHMYDPVTRLVYMRERWYSPELAQFLEPDPLGPAEVGNLYTLCEGDTINQIDPYGLLTWGQWAGIAAAIVVGVAVTALTGGAAAAVLGPVIGALVSGAIAGAAGAVAGEFLESQIDEREANYGRAALWGAAGGAVFAGLGQALGAAAATQTGRALAAAAAGTKPVQAVLRWGFHAANRARPLRDALQGVGRRAAAVTDASAAAGERLGARLGGWFARNARASAERRGMLAFARAASQSRRGLGARPAPPRVAGEELGLRLARVSQESSGAAASVTGRLGRTTVFARTLGGNRHPSFILTPLRPSPFTPAVSPPALQRMGLQGMRVPRCGQALEEAGAQIADAELKLLGHLLVTSAPESQGVLALAANQVMCPSCFANLLRFRALRPGIDIFTSLPNQWFAGAGAAGAGAAAESAAD